MAAAGAGLLTVIVASVVPGSIGQQRVMGKYDLPRRARCLQRLVEPVQLGFVGAAPVKRGALVIARIGDRSGVETEEFRGRQESRVALEGHGEGVITRRHVPLVR